MVTMMLLKLLHSHPLLLCKSHLQAVLILQCPSVLETREATVLRVDKMLKKRTIQQEALLTIWEKPFALASDHLAQIHMLGGESCFRNIVKPFAIVLVLRTISLGGISLARIYSTVSPPFSTVFVPNPSITSFSLLIDHLERHLRWWGDKLENGLLLSGLYFRI